ERPLLLRHTSVEDDLKQKVAEFVAQVGKIVARDRVGDFVGFLERVRRDGLEILLEIPGTAGLWRAQRRHNLQQPRDIAGGSHVCSLVMNLCKTSRCPQTFENV